MTDGSCNESNGPNDAEETPASFVAPGDRGRDLTDDELSSEMQQVRDLGSASRSCVAIIVVLLIVSLVLCVFLFWAFFIA
ncbi:MAG: hypothetical protein ACR2GS_06595 [Thermomicrobiales bacterium]|jgi:hypothetical protein